MYRTTRRKSVPLIYVTGSHYDVGFDIGRTFATAIKNVIDEYEPLNKVYIPYYETAAGREAYRMSMQSVEIVYPHYIRELSGMADGCKVPFYKLYLLHLDDILVNYLHYDSAENCSFTSDCEYGKCTTIFTNYNKKRVLGHTVDGSKILLNNLFLVKARITESNPHQKFMALCCVGLLPGNVMGFNCEGLVYTVNTINAKRLNIEGIPRTFICRDILRGSSVKEIVTILKCTGFGLADALSVNVTFIDKFEENNVNFHNIEACPLWNLTRKESIVNAFKLSYNYYFHTNRFQHLKKVSEVPLTLRSSEARESTLIQLIEQKDCRKMNKLLGDTSQPVHNIFLDYGDKVITVAAAIIDFESNEWKIYLDNPESTKPNIVILLNTKDYFWK